MRRFVLLCVAFASVTKGKQARDRFTECIRSNGADYRGEQQITLMGRKCLNWTHATRDDAATAGLDLHAGIGDHNFCRNPDSSMTPWCYVIGQDGLVQRQACVIEACRGAEMLNPVHALSTLGEGAAVGPVVGPGHWIHTDPTRKKGLGIGGHVLGIIMMTIIILLGMGITGGYIYKMGRDLRRRRERQEHEQETQRLALPLSAFSNPTCQLLDEVTAAPTSNSAEERAPAGGRRPPRQPDGDIGDLKRVPGPSLHPHPQTTVGLDSAQRKWAAPIPGVTNTVPAATRNAPKDHMSRPRTCSKNSTTHQ